MSHGTIRTGFPDRDWHLCSRSIPAPHDLAALGVETIDRSRSLYPGGAPTAAHEGRGWPTYACGPCINGDVGCVHRFRPVTLADRQVAGDITDRATTLAPKGKHHNTSRIDIGIEGTSNADIMNLMSQDTDPGNDTREDGHGLERIAPRGRVRRVPYHAEQIDLIGEALGVEVGLAPFRLPGAAVYQLLVPGRDDRPAAMLTLWPSLHRVDAIGGTATIVFTRVTMLHLVEDVEVQFRRDNGEYLIVARGGKIIVRA